MKIRKLKDRNNPFQKSIEPKVSSLHINGSIIHPTVQSMYSIQSRPWPDEAQKKGTQRWVSSTLLCIPFCLAV